MKKILRAFIASTILTATALSVQAAPVKMTLTYDGVKHSYNAESIELRVNGEALTLTDMPPVILNGRTYVPAREVFEPIGAVVDWKASTQEVYIGYNGNLVIMKANRNTANVNGKDIKLETPAKLINSKLMLPARFVSDQFGIPVEWDSKNRIVSIGSEIPAVTEVPEGIPPTTPADTPEEPQAPVTTAPVVETPTAPVVTPPDPPVVTPPVVTAPEVPFDNNPSIPGLSADTSTYRFTTQASELVNINQITANGLSYTISASGAMSRVDKQLLPENKLVLDIHNAHDALPTGIQNFDNFSGVTAVRNSQFASDPQQITRVVFDLSGATRYTVSMSADRKSIVVTFEPMRITGVQFTSIGNTTEQVNIASEIPPVFKVSREYNPERLILETKAKSTLPVGDQFVNGKLMTKYSVTQTDSDTTRISLTLGENVQYTITSTSTGASVMLTEAPYKNITIDDQANATFTLKGLSGVTPESIIHTDNYLNGEYKLTLPGDFSAQLGSGSFPLSGDGNVESVTIATSGGKTELTFQQNRIMGYRVTQNGTNLMIHAMDPREIYPIVIYLDAGHGDSDAGASANGIKEKDVNLDIMLRLYQHLEADPNFKVYASRLEDTYPKNIDRAHNANAVADLFVSIHHNAASNGNSSGTEVLYYNHEGEAYPEISSEGVARIMQTNLIDALGTVDRGVVRRPDLIVLNSTDIPAVLVEVAFLTNSGDAAKVKDANMRQAAADALYRSIKEVFVLYPTGR